MNLISSRSRRSRLPSLLIATLGLFGGTLVLTVPEANAISAGTISGGYVHTCALTTGGGVKCWGFNANAQLGDGSTTDSYSPVDVVGLSSGVTELSAGWDQTCALVTGGAARCWGANYYGDLGDGSTAVRTSPVGVTGLSSGVTAISAGFMFTCAVDGGGGVKCWGRGDVGQLGNGSTVPSSTPVAVTGLGSGVEAVAAGDYHACALTSGGAVKCWGRNDEGQLGDGSRTSNLTPVAVTGLGSGVTAITASGSHTCALTTAGAAKCWGDNYFGELGDGSLTRRKTPVGVTGLSSGVEAVSTGADATCALTTAGSVRCWGDNTYGELGDGSNTGRLVPVGVVGLDAGVETLSTGGFHACALTTLGAATCWGWDHYGQLGDGVRTTSRNYKHGNAPVAVLGFQGAYQPDVQIATASTGPYTGDNVYNSTGAGQATRAQIAAGSSVTFFVHLQNDGDTRDSFVLAGRRGGKRFGVRYLKGATDITSEVVAGAYTTAPVAPGETISLRITVEATALAVSGSKIVARLIATSAAAGTLEDAVTAVVST